MLGPITVGKKAASWGYKRYGLPGAVVTGAVGVAGYAVARKKLRRAVDDREAGGGDGGSDAPRSTDGSPPAGGGS